MNYIIPAAGMGTRLLPLTQKSAKCLFMLDQGTTIIRRMVNLLHEFDKDASITVVTGFSHEKIENELKNEDVKFIHNPFLKVTNSIASLWLAREFLHDETVIINSDIVFERSLCRDVITEAINKNEVLIDASIQTDGDYNVQVHGDLVTVMSKELHKYYAEYAGITRLTADGADVLREEISRMIDEGYYDQWYENALVQMIFSDSFELHYTDIQAYSWTEVDNVDDLIKAREIQDNF